MYTENIHCREGRRDPSKARGNPPDLGRLGRSKIPTLKEQRNDLRLPARSSGKRGRLTWRREDPSLVRLHLPRQPRYRRRVALTCRAHRLGWSANFFGGFAPIHAGHRGRHGENKCFANFRPTNLAGPSAPGAPRSSKRTSGHKKLGSQSTAGERASSRRRASRDPTKTRPARFVKLHRSSSSPAEYRSVFPSFLCEPPGRRYPTWGGRPDCNLFPTQVHRTC